MVPHLERRTAANTTALRRFHAICLCRSPPPPIGRTAAGALGQPDLEMLFEKHFIVKRFPHSLNVTIPDSDVRVQIQTDERYSSFLERAFPRSVLGMELPVASVEDVLQGKIWAALDSDRRGSKRQKDLADIARILENYPQYRSHVPKEILERLLD